MFFFYVSRDLTLPLAESLLTAICLVRILINTVSDGATKTLTLNSERAQHDKLSQRI